MRDNTLFLIEEARAELEEYNPMTLRQVYYRLVSRHILKNTVQEYKRLSYALVQGRQEGIIPWDWIEDRLRQPHKVGMWGDLTDFADTAIAAYRKNVWHSQPRYVEVWLEKDALSGVFLQVLYRYGVTLNVGRGYDSWSSIWEASCRLSDEELGEPTVVLYFGDFDPSGEDMVRSLGERLGFFGCEPEIIKVALTMEDIDRYELPPMMAKRTDSRSASFIAKHGDVAVELDALPPKVLAERVREMVREMMDCEALEEVWETESEERNRLRGFLEDA